MTEPLRHEPGPRDWTPGGSGFNFPPPSGPPTYAAPPPAPRSVSQLRGIGALAVLLGLGGLIFALRPVDPTIGRNWILAVVGPLAIVLGSIGLVKMRSLNGFDRIASAIGVGLGTIGTVGLLAALAGVWSGIPVAPDYALPPAVAPAATQSPTVALQVSPEDDRLALVQAAGTFSFLANQDAAASGSYPSVIQATSTGYLFLMSGTVQLPPGSTASYVAAADGASYVLTLTGATGASAVYDSTVGTIESFTP